MSRSQKLLVCAGLVLLIVGMCHGLWYAVFAEHQRLTQIGSSLAASFASASGGDLQSSRSALEAYGEAKYLYAREVDAHSHWGGLAILLILFGAAFHRVGFEERTRFWLASTLSASSCLFPLSVIVQNVDHGPLPRVAAALISFVLIASMMVVAAGFIRSSKT
jgi:hypothetical protein